MLYKLTAESGTVIFTEKQELQAVTQLPAYGCLSNPVTFMIKPATSC